MTDSGRQARSRPRVPPANVLPVDLLIERALAAARQLAAGERASARDAHMPTAPRKAPETTGRTAHAVDGRADLYELGASLYEWATGRPPFEESDPLRLVHEQLTRVPAAPGALRAELPEPLSGIILRLLEKEPARRYNSPQGLIHDLERLRRSMRRGRRLSFTLGERDFPARLAAPDHPVGRAPELTAFRRALEDVSQGGCRSVLVCGPAGVGKTALVNELHAIAASANARFVTGAFDEYGRKEPAGIVEAMGALARLLLAEPDEALAAQRSRILGSLGHEAVLACVIPEFKVLLGDLPPPAPADPAHVNARLMKLVTGLLRAIASAQRPVVLVLDGLQWSRVATVRLIENLAAGDGVTGLLLVAVYRTGDMTPSHPVAAAIASWQRRQPSLEVMQLANLDEDCLSQMLAQMLRIPVRRTKSLAHSLAPHTGGNPHDTVELVNELRQEGLLVANASGWRWNEEALARYVGSHGRSDPLVSRVARLPAPARELLEVLACLKSQVPPAAALAASGLDEAEFRRRVRTLAVEGMLIEEAGAQPVLKLRHDRIQKAGYAAIAPQLRRELHLAIARRLAAQAFDAPAASQYLEAAESIPDDAERMAAASLLFAEAKRTRGISNHAAAQRLLEAALRLLGQGGIGQAGGEALRIACEIELHQTLCTRGRLAEADSVYAAIESHEPDPLRFAEAACAQVASLTKRERRAEAIGLGLQFLARLGIDVPRRPDAAAFAPAFDRLRAWARGFGAAGEPGRADPAGPEVVAAAKMFNRLVSPVFSADTGLACWLVFENLALWERHGPLAPLAANLSYACLIAGTFGDLRTGYELGRSLTAFCESRGWEPQASHCRYMLATCSLHWFEPLEAVLRQAQLAKDGLLAAGDLESACFSFRALTVAAFDCAPTLERFGREVGAALELAWETGNSQAHDWYRADLQLLRALRGETASLASFDTADFDAASYLAKQETAHGVLLGFHLRRAICCAIFGLAQPLAEHAGAALAAVMNTCFYSTARLRWLGAIADAWQLQQARDAGQALADAPVARLEASIEWLAAQVNGAPANFRPLHLHACAERAWALGDSKLAALFFDQALDAVESSSRPWWRALITERAARFQLSQGRLRAGRQLLNESRELYRAWGAPAKVAQLDAAMQGGHGAPDMPPEAVQRVSAADELDTIAILRASQALGSERNAQRLKARVEEVLGSIVGATRVVLALWDEDEEDWRVDDPSGAPMPVAEASTQLALSAFRYAERTREPLLLADALADDRFARDPYFRGMERCSLMVVPILHQGAARAMLVLENRTSRGAFTTARLDAVMMIAGQLAVSLESAQLYERLERKVRDQTQELREAQSRLLAEARRAGMAQIATNVLHNVGNVLNNVNVSAHVLAERVRRSRTSRVGDLAALLRPHAGRLAAYLESDDKGKLLPRYVSELADALATERDELLGELARLASSVDHIKNVVAMQQSYAGASGSLDPGLITELIEDALRIEEDSLARHGVTVARDYGAVQAVALDKTRVMQILVNLVENARHAMLRNEGPRVLEVSARQQDGWIDVSVKDNGCGISPEHIDLIFSHGFTTKPDGHGFGLHSCALAAREMGASIAAYSDGPAKGATFVLQLPAGSGK